jgi:uncharacterized membrane protein
LLILVLKLVHILSAVVFLGTGLGIAWMKLRGDRSGDPHVVAWIQHEVVRADLFFTIPAGLTLPMSGIAMAHLMGLPLTTPWVLWGLGCYAFAGVTWLPAAFLQVRMRVLADAALQGGQPLPAAFWTAHRIWWALGVPSFGATMLAMWWMVARRSPF